MNPLLGMFLCTVIMQDKYRWSYGRKPHDVKKFGKSIIKLPIQYNSKGSPIIDKTLLIKHMSATLYSLKESFRLVVLFMTKWSGVESGSFLK